jgi:L-ascorbate metabolism protein UlaG (beta-lactamase superfamily)
MTKFLVCLLCVTWLMTACGPTATPLVATSAPPTIAPTVASKQPATVDVTYIANAGFLIRTLTKTILVDAIFTEGFGEYLTPSPDLLKSMTTSQPPFDHVDLVLATHHHGDHVDSSTIAAHLAHNPEGVLVGPESVVAPLASNASLQRQLRQVMPAASEWITTTVNGIEITAFNIQHDNRPAIQHVGFIVAVDSVKLLLLGDSVGWNPSEFGPYHLDQDKIDLALLNFYGFWQSGSQRELVKKFIRPQRVILTHIPPARFESVTEQVKLIDDPDYPPISLLQNSLDTIRFTQEDGKMVTFGVSP